MLVICVKVELVLYDGGQLVDALLHVGVIREYPDVGVLAEVEIPKHGRPPPAPAAGTHRRNGRPRLSGIRHT